MQVHYEYEWRQLYVAGDPHGIDTGHFLLFPDGGGFLGGLEWMWQLPFICIATEIHPITII